MCANPFQWIKQIDPIIPVEHHWLNLSKVFLSLEKVSVSLARIQFRQTEKAEYLEVRLVSQANFFTDGDHLCPAAGNGLRFC